MSKNDDRACRCSSCNTASCGGKQNASSGCQCTPVCRCEQPCPCDGCGCKSRER